MRSVLPELTAQEVIRRMAMDLFASRGADRVTIRDIATASGVSPALVIHHYGSKKQLRASVDERVLTMMEHLITDVAGSMGARTAGSIAELCAIGLESEPHLVAYLRRMLIEGGPSAVTILKRLLEVTSATMSDLERTGVVRPSANSPIRDAFLLVNDLAVIILRNQLNEVLGIDPLSGDGLEAWSEEVLAVYGNGMMATPPQAPGQ